VVGNPQELLKKLSAMPLYPADLPFFAGFVVFLP
jgi:hypothetical protein